MSAVTDVTYKIRAISGPKQTFAYVAQNLIITERQHAFILPREPKTIVELHFENCILHCFPQRIAEFFPNLKTINASNCQLGSVTREDFFGLSELTHLSLSRNNIKELTDHVFLHTPKLQRIHLRQNQLKLIDKLTFEGLRDLSYVDLKKNPNFSCILNTTHKFANREEFQKIIVKNFEVVSFPRVDSDEVRIPKSLLALEELKDFTIKIGHQKFHVHRMFLAVHSEVFKKMFVDHPTVTEAEISDVTYDAMKAVIDYIYEGKLPTGDFDFKQYYLAAHKLGIAKLQRYAEDEMLKQISKFNLNDNDDEAELYGEQLEFIEAMCEVD